MIEDYVCSLELSKKLKELGINQKSLFRWEMDKDNEDMYSCEFIIFSCPCIKYYPAFIVSELLNILPNIINIKGNEPFNNFRLEIVTFKVYPDMKCINAYSINYYCDSTEVVGEYAWLKRKLINESIYDTNLSNAAAKTLIYLIENKLYEYK